MHDREEYRIIIFISHRSISFEYYQRDGAGKVVPVPFGNCQWPEPLAFYSSNMETMIGRAALSAYNSGTPNAFNGYFEHLPKNMFYTRAGAQKQFGKILLDAAEEVFSSFFREQLLNNRGDLTANRSTMPLMIVCEEDVKDTERAHLAKLFRDAGYGKASVVSYKKFVERYARESLAKNYNCDYALEVWTEGSDLTMALINLKGTGDSPTAILEGLGRDPRLDFVKDKIWQDMLGFNGFLEREREEDAIERAAQDFLNGTENVVDGRITTSDGSGYNYWLNRFEINFIETEDSTLIKRGVSNFLLQNGLKERDRILLVLRGNIPNNSYFEGSLTNGFDQILRSSKSIRSQVKDLIVAEPIIAREQPDISEPKEPTKPQNSEKPEKEKQSEKQEKRGEKPESSKIRKAPPLPNVGIPTRPDAGTPPGMPPIPVPPVPPFPNKQEKESAGKKKTEVKKTKKLSDEEFFGIPAPKTPVNKPVAPKKPVTDDDFFGNTTKKNKPTHSPKDNFDF